MTIYEEKDYHFSMQNGDKFLDQAETFYSEGKLNLAIKKYYNAAISFEIAKEIAKKGVDVRLEVAAKEKEFYCNEKIDEIEKFKKVNLNENVR